MAAKDAFVSEHQFIGNRIFTPTKTIQTASGNQMIRIVEIYANKAAYHSHLKTPHFQHYKTTTLKMVKSLKLVDMEALDKGTMPQIFEKAKSEGKKENTHENPTGSKM